MTRDDDDEDDDDDDDEDGDEGEMMGSSCKDEDNGDH